MPPHLPITTTHPNFEVLSTFVSPAAEFLESREFRGLEIKEGETKVHTATEGKTGIASDYKGI